MVDRPEGVKLLDSRWVFKVERDHQNNPKTFKARLCIRGCKQEEGIDYVDTYAPVVKYESLRILFAVASQLDLEIIQFDVKAAFLYGDLKQTIYIKIPTGLKVANASKKACRLLKVIYGLKQASRSFNKKLCKFLKKFGFRRCKSEGSVFVRIKNNRIMYLAVWVDGGAIFAESLSDANEVISVLKERFEIKVSEVDTFVEM